MADATNKIAKDAVKELRVLSHDLSNSLETIVQANYMLGQSAPTGSTARWIEMIDQASQEAVQISRRLRELLRGL